MMDILSNPRHALMVHYFACACSASRAHSAIARDAYQRFGDKGPLISGCEQSHFPERIKDQLRMLARECREYSEKAYAARPPRMHAATVRLIGQHVATRDGSGRYGPQPLRG